jgi:hypothetical protein
MHVFIWWWFSQFPKKTPTWEPAMHEEVGPEATTAIFENMKIGIWYEIRVHAFSSKGDGELSRPLTFKMREK